MKKYVYTSSKQTYDEAFEEMKEDLEDIIDELLKRNTTSFTLELVKCKRYEYKGKEDFECETYKEYDMELDDLFDSKEEAIETLFNTACWFYDKYNQCKKDIK